MFTFISNNSTTNPFYEVYLPVAILIWLRHDVLNDLFSDIEAHPLIKEHFHFICTDSSTLVSIQLFEHLVLILDFLISRNGHPTAELGKADLRWVVDETDTEGSQRLVQIFLIIYNFSAGHDECWLEALTFEKVISVLPFGSCFRLESHL